MGLFNRTSKWGYSTEPATDPESGEKVTAVRSEMAGGHITSYHGSRREARKHIRRSESLADQTYGEPRR